MEEALAGDVEEVGGLAEATGVFLRPRAANAAFLRFYTHSLGRPFQCRYRHSIYRLLASRLTLKSVQV